MKVSKRQRDLLVYNHLIKFLRFPTLTFIFIPFEKYIFVVVKISIIRHRAVQITPENKLRHIKIMLKSLLSDHHLRRTDWSVVHTSILVIRKRVKLQEVSKIRMDFGWKKCVRVLSCFIKKQICRER